MKVVHDDDKSNRCYITFIKHNFYFNVSFEEPFMAVHKKIWQKYVYCYSDSRNLWTVMRAGGLAP
jgi:hypothetical protein